MRFTARCYFFHQEDLEMEASVIWLLAPITSLLTFYLFFAA